MNEKDSNAHTPFADSFLLKGFEAFRAVGLFCLCNFLVTLYSVRVDQFSAIGVSQTLKIDNLWGKKQLDYGASELETLWLFLVLTIIKTLSRIFTKFNQILIHCYELNTQNYWQKKNVDRFDWAILLETRHNVQHFIWHNNFRIAKQTRSFMMILFF